MAEALKAAGVQPEPRAAFLTDPFTSRDLFGVCRGRCLQCGDCGKYLKATADYTISAGDQGRRHPDNDPSITRCSRCGCLPEAHEVAEHEQEREQGNDAFAQRRYDVAVTHYSRALELCPTDAALWSNRAAAYLAKGWPQQALHDAERALALRPDWPKAWGRKGAALLQLGQPAAAAEAYRRALQLEQSQGGSSGGGFALRDGLRQAQAQAQAAVVKQQKAAEAAKRRQQQQQQQRSQAPLASAAKASAAPKAASTGPQMQAQSSSMAPAAPQHASSMASEATRTGPAAVAAPAAAATFLAQQPRTQVGTPDILMAAWQALQQQAGEAAAALARLQQQMQAFEALLLAAGQPAGTAQQPQLPASEDPSPSSLSAECSSTVPAGASKDEEGGAAAAAAAGVPSPVTAAPLEASRPPGSPTSGAESSLGSLNSLPGSPAVAAARTQSGAGSPACRRSAGTTADGAVPCSYGGGDSDSEVEEAYSELPPAAAAAAASRPPAPAPSMRPSSVGSRGMHGAAGQQASAASVVLGSEASASGGSGSGSAPSSPRTGPARRTSSSDSSSNEDGSSRSSGETSEGSDVDDGAWLASVEDARRRLAAEGARLTPPAKAGRRGPKPAQVSGTEDGALASLRQMCADAEAAAMALDASGTPRASCKQCGTEHCPRYRPASVLSEEALAAVLSRQAAAGAGLGTPDACTCCRCPSTAHETPREFATRQARERRQRLRAQRQANGTAAAAATTGASAAAAAAKGGGAFQAEAVDDRQRRVAAAAERRAAAQAAGDVLQESDCDMLTQQRRTTCSGCASCPGFRLVFRACDANDPEVMFYCSACGCRSDQHAVDAEWQQHEAARRAAEVAASERRQAAAAASSGAAAAARKAEAEAFATLGLPLGADSKSINRAYKRLALQLHPDKQQRVSAAEAAAAAARFVRVSAAYKLLSGS